MSYVLRWGNRTWLYGAMFGLGIGMAVLLIFWQMLGKEAFLNYYSPMLGYYVLLSICQSHYFRRKPVPDMGGLFRQFASIFGAVVIFFVNQTIMINIFAVPEITHPVLDHGGIVMTGHFSFIVFGFFIYGFDDFMFKGKLVGWMKNDVVKAVFWYLIIWVVWVFLFYFGVGKGHSALEYSSENMDQLLAISQWVIIMSLLYALVFKDWLPDLQMKLRMRNDYLFGAFLFVAAVAIGAAVAYLCYAALPHIAPWEEPLTNGERWHRVLYMGTYPLTPAVLLGLYSNNFTSTSSAGWRVVKRLIVLIPLIVLLYFFFHLVIAQPELIPNWLSTNWISPGLLDEGMGIFHSEGGWYHQLDLYFNFTVSIIPLTHHWFCGKWGFMKKIEEE
ncbi:MAG: hypothetical protein JW939_01860 [Candidatus Thermoplasmatota archaeon]|nr:hypothetical protein [Candidatus Thermoplasmatota archaeon]